MNKHFLMSQMKSTGTAYLCWFFLGCHYAYLGKWGLQIAFWLTFGGVGIWALVDLFHMPTKVSNHNRLIAIQIDEIEKKEKEDAHLRNMALIAAATGNKNRSESNS